MLEGGKCKYEKVVTMSHPLLGVYTVIYDCIRICGC